jgi:heme exporter protein C
MAISFLTSAIFLVKRESVYDRIAETSAILGLVYGCVAIIGGSIWANAVWGIYWNWDPRETTTLVLWMAYAGYVSLRRSIGNVGKQAVIGAVYNILAFSTVPLSYLSIRLWHSLHPQLVTPSEIFITVPMIETLLLNLLAASLIYVYFLKVMFNVASVEGQVNSLVYAKGGDAYGT